MTTMTQLDVASSEKTSRRRATLPRTGAVRDLAADWKRWSLAERIIAAAIVPTVALTILMMSTALVSGGH